MLVDGDSVANLPRLGKTLYSSEAFIDECEWTVVLTLGISNCWTTCLYESRCVIHTMDPILDFGSEVNVFLHGRVFEEHFIVAPFARIELREQGDITDWIAFFRRIAGNSPP